MIYMQYFFREFFLRGMDMTEITTKTLLAGLPMVQIVSGFNKLVLAINSNNECVVAQSDPTDSKQLWQLVAYPDKNDSMGNAFALVIVANDGHAYCLKEIENSKTPVLGPWTGGLSAYFQIGNGISIRRDSEYCLSISGERSWSAGNKVDIWKWQNNESNYPNQFWTFRTVS